MARGLRRLIRAHAHEPAGELIGEFEGLQVEVAPAARKQRFEVLDERRHDEFIAPGGEQIEQPPTQRFESARLVRKDLLDPLGQQPARARAFLSAVDMGGWKYFQRLTIWSSASPSNMLVRPAKRNCVSRISLRAASARRVPRADERENPLEHQQQRQSDRKIVPHDARRDLLTARLLHVAEEVGARIDDHDVVLLLKLSL